MNRSAGTPTGAEINQHRRRHNKSIIQSRQSLRREGGECTSTGNSVKWWMGREVERGEEGVNVEGWGGGGLYFDAIKAACGSIRKGGGEHRAIKAGLGQVLKGRGGVGEGIYFDCNQDSVGGETQRV